MTEIVAGELRYIDETKNANGGTELMARRMVRDIPKELLEPFQIIHSRARKLEPDLKKILICHDLASDPEVKQLADPDYRKQFHKIVFVSHWQQHTYNMVLGVPFSESCVIKNAIEPFDNIQKNKEGPIKLIYHTTPHRGLELLVPAVKEVQKHFDVELDVYSSFAAYGWNDRDKPYEKLFEDIENTPGMNYHGFQSNGVVREALKKSDIFAYPNTWVETSCLALIEAMCSGNFCLHSNLGALPETSMGLTSTYMFNENVQDHVNHFYSILIQVINEFHNSSDRGNYNQTISNIANFAYNWNFRKMEWENWLKTWMKE